MENCCGAKTAFDNVTARFVFDGRLNAGIDTHLERKAGASIDFEDVSTRAFDFLSSRPALQDFPVSQIYPTLVTHLGGESDWLGW
jgi:hypothetical protein